MITLTILIIAIPFILIVALFSQKGFIVTREVTINRPIALVFNYLSFLKNQEYFHVLLMSDPKMEKEFSGTDGTINFTYAWKSKNPKVGTASQKLVQITESEKIEIEVLFEKPFKSKAQLIIELTANDTLHTDVKWTFIGNEHPYYTLRVGQLLFMVKRAVGKDLEKSLNNLKNLLENN